VTVSTGLAERLPGERMASLIERADAALYASKRAGRNRTTAAAAKISAAA
jgi:diguanylate cyclase